jgi:hypothetical protein
MFPRLKGCRKTCKASSNNKQINATSFSHLFTPLSLLLTILSHLPSRNNKNKNSEYNMFRNWYYYIRIETPLILNPFYGERICILGDHAED